MSKTHLITFVLDETISMLGRKDATISGFNEWMEEMEKFAGVVEFTMVKFNTNKHELAYKQAVLGAEKIRLDRTNYRPSAATPLYDAISRAIRETEDVLSEREDNPSVTFVILTDGEENSSQECTLETIKHLIGEKEEDGWTFTYLGVSQDSWRGGFDLGISSGNIMNLSGEDTLIAFSAHAQSTTRHLDSGGVQTSEYYSGQTDRNSQLIVDDTESEDE